MSFRDKPVNADKLRAAILHVISSCKPDNLGAVKLHKVLYYTDMMTFLDTGSPVTNATYRKRPFGPTCDVLLAALEDLEAEGAIEVETVDYHGFKKKEFTLKAPSKTNQLSDDEKTTLDEMIDFVCNNNTAKSISDFSHDMVWEMVEFGEVIPYHNAINLIPHEASKEALEWGQAEAKRIADIRSGTEAEREESLALVDVSAVRARMVERIQQR